MGLSSPHTSTTFNVIYMMAWLLSMLTVDIVEFIHSQFRTKSIIIVSCQLLFQWFPSAAKPSTGSWLEVIFGLHLCESRSVLYHTTFNLIRQR